MAIIKLNSLSAPANTFGGGGKILQVVQTEKTDTFSMSGTTFTDVTGLSVAITPSSTSSKILIVGSVLIGAQTNFGFIRMLRDSTVINVGAAASNRPLVNGTFSYTATDNIWELTNNAINYVDSPSTTSQVTYKIQIRGGTSGAAYVNRTHNDRDTANYDPRGSSSLIAMEISG